MKTILRACLIIGVLSLLPYTANAQENKKEQIAKALNGYFHLERENIHVHFDKNVFLNREEVWFKGYVYHRKKNTPFFASINIFASLIDSDGAIIETQLLYGNLGSFSGKFRLGENIKPGRYYIQFYTNWMNNFKEDESFVQEITVVSEEPGGARLLGKPDASTVNIELHPEGGTLVQGVTNTIGISISGCNHAPIDVASADIINPDGKVIKTIPLNNQGYGSFSLPGDALTGYKAGVTYDGVRHEVPLPAAQLTGAALEVNNYAIADKTILKIKTNKNTLNSLLGKQLFAVIHQDEKVVILDVALNNNLEQSLVLANKELFEGLNTIRIIDSDMNQLAERVIYKYPASGPAIDLAKTGQDHQFAEVSGKVAPNMNISISVLPQNTISLTDSCDIYNSFLIAPYIESPRNAAGKYYLNTSSKARRFEMDLFLLSCKSKYEWRDILASPPKSNYSFDIGLSLKGTINQPLNAKDNYKVRVRSIAGMIDDYVDINENKEFYLNNIIVPDSTSLTFSLIKNNIKFQDIKLYPQISNHNKKFNKPYKPEKTQCNTVKENDTMSDSFDLPGYYTKTVILDEVKIETNANTLKYSKRFGNGQLRGYKITNAESRSFFYILDLIRYHGFDVVNENGRIAIYGRTVNTINGQRTRPQVFVDNMQLLGYDMLQNIMTEDVDEFYINQHAIVPGVDNRMGIIRIYMKRGFAHREKKKTEATFLIEDGFEEIPPFKNISYSSTSDRGFENIGIVDWHPVITADNTGKFEFSIPKIYKGTVKLLIEGINPEGRIVSEVKTIEL